MSDMDRFMSKVEKTAGCWNWMAGKKAGGYGTFFFRGSLRGAHRVSLFLFKGEAIDTPLDAMHSCDNPSCVNPDHLSYGSRKKNMQDASSKGRTVNVSDWSGSKNPKAKLDASQRTELEALIKSGEKSRVIADRFGVSIVRVQQISRKLKVEMAVSK